MQILYCGSGWLPVVGLIRERLAERLPDAEIRVWDRREPLADAARGIDVILPSNARVGADVIDAAEQLRLLQQPAAGVDVVDLEAARRRKIPVANAPGANHGAVAEAATYLLLALARRAKAADAAFARAEIGAVAGMELRGKTLGIIGYGRSGRAFADIARGLGMQILSTNRSSSAEAWERLWTQSDAISLHCPLTAATDKLVGAEALARMKPGALLINLARGPILDRGAIEEALSTGSLGGLGLDVFWEEPWSPDDPLYQRENVIATPHIAGATREALDRIADIVCENVARVARGDPPRNQIP